MTQPASQTVNVGSSATFSVAASGTAPMTYQWLFNGGNMTGQTSSTLNLSQVQQSQAGKYSVIVSNVAGTATSATAVLSVLSTGSVSSEIIKPKLSIVTPKKNEKWSSAAFTVSGKASDNAGVAKVYYSLNGSGWVSASTGNNWANWTANVTLTPGANIIQAYAVDGSGNVSATDTVTFMYVLKAVLTVNSTVGGKISPNYNGKLLEVGVNYSMTAKAKNGFAFTNWTGSVTTNGATLEFTMTSNLTFTANFVDIAAPTLNIESPKSKQHVDSSAFTVTGKAKDNVAVANVYYSLNGSGWASASTANGWAKWMANVTLTKPGTNTIQAYAVDTSGHLSATDSVSFIYVAMTPLTVLINGSGTVSPDYNGKLLQIGQNYSMTAKAKKGFAFVNWTGSARTNGAKLEFTMASNLTFTANFSDAASLAVQTELSQSQLSVQILPPDINDLNVDQGMATVWFDSQTNVLYTLESKDSMADTNWTTLPVSIIGTGDTISLTDSNAPPASRFYRVGAQAAQ
ncbi:MAG: InlB B-repeat-containing protein [Limisphaerales bacterium]